MGAQPSFRQEAGDILRFGQLQRDVFLFHAGRWNPDIGEYDLPYEFGGGQQEMPTFIGAESNSKVSF